MDAGTRYGVTEPYIFISYNHRDRDRVFPALDGLRGRGYRLWYDADIQAGEQWTDELAERIADCAVFLPFLSESYDRSDPCMQEIRYANSRQRTVVPVWLTEKHSLSGKLQYHRDRLFRSGRLLVGSELAGKGTGGIPKSFGA